MEKKLKALFEYQRFEGNTRLAKLISDTEEYYTGRLSDDILDMVNAAGDALPDKDPAKDESVNGDGSGCHLL